MINLMVGPTLKKKKKVEVEAEVEEDGLLGEIKHSWY